MNWATKRRLQYLGGLFTIIILILFIILYPIIFKKPTCSDGKKNGVETGIDCGGSCSLMCKGDISLPIVLWSRAFPVVENTYNLVALIENQNKNSGVEKASYEFKIYNEKGRMIGTRQGVTFIPPNKQFAIFESQFYAGESDVKNVSFEFKDDLIWVKKETQLNNLDIYIDKINMGEDKENPSLSARVRNDSVYDIPYLEFIVLLYDEDRNVINVSKTFRESLLSGLSNSIYFTWPNKLSSDPVIKEVLISINPFNISFRGYEQ